MFPLPESAMSAGPHSSGLEWTTGSEGPIPQMLNSILTPLRNFAPANPLCVWSCIYLCPVAKYLFHIKVTVLFFFFFRMITWPNGSLILKQKDIL